MHLLQSDDPRPAADHFAIRVDDLDEAVEDLRARDVKVHTSTYVPGAGHQAFLHDPFGNFIELNQPDS